MQRGSYVISVRRGRVLRVPIFKDDDGRKAPPTSAFDSFLLTSLKTNSQSEGETVHTFTILQEKCEWQKMQFKLTTLDKKFDFV